MLYHPLKLLARIALKIYCRDIYTHNTALLRQQGPLFIASNHPNSFLDAVIIAVHCRQKTYILVRGDVFKNKWAARILKGLFCLPIYRKSEGKEMMSRNEEAFSESLRLLRKGYNILIFAEGICENEWTLRPLGKGAARLASRAWQDSRIAPSFKVLPAGLTYSNFNAIGKQVTFMIGEPLLRTGDTSAKTLSELNASLEESLCGLIVRMPDTPEKRDALQSMMEAGPRRKNTLEWCRDLQSRLETPGEEERSGPARTRTNGIPAIGAAFALAGWLIQAPLYYPMRAIARRMTRHTVFYDSVFFGLLLFLYPLYVAALTLAITCITGNAWWLLLAVLLPLSTRVTVRYFPRRKRARRSA